MTQHCLCVLRAQAREIPGIKIYRFESSLYYANCEHFLTKLFDKSRVNPRQLRQQQVKVEKKQRKLAEERDRQLRKRHGDVSVCVLPSTVSW